jgi:hypothetical protein
MIEHVDVPHFGKVRISRRKGARSIRISLHQNGDIRLSLPFGVSTSEGIRFLEQKRTWIARHKNDTYTLADGARLGNTHTIRVIKSAKSKARTYVTDNQLILYVPEQWSEEQIHEKISSSAKNLLSSLAQRLLVQRVSALASQHGYNVRSIDIKPLKARWGSCSSRNELVFNSYLMQLPWMLIDYVVYHELAHTVEHNHSAAFWREVQKHIPDYAARRKLLKKFPTDIFDAREIERFVS